MANSIHIEIQGPKEKQYFTAVLQENPTMEVGSEFSSFAELAPEFANLATVVTAGFSSMGGSIGKGMLSLGAKLDIPRWTKTNPIKFNTTLTFYCKSSAYDDVWLPTNLLLSCAILSYDESTGQYLTPGSNLANMGSLGKNGEKLNALEQEALIQSNRKLNDDLQGSMKPPSAGNWKTLSKICSFWIPGVVYVPMGVIRAAQPTYSKQCTKEGYPLWSKLEVALEGLYPAMDFNLNASRALLNDVSQDTTGRTAF